MATNPLLKSIRSGVRMNSLVGDAFAKIGTNAHPRGDVLSAYKTARLAMRSTLSGPNPLRDTQDVLRNLRRDLQVSVGQVFDDAVMLGKDEAGRQLRFYDVIAQGNINLSFEMQSALDAVLLRFDAQEAAIRALLYTDAEAGQIIGDEERTGVLAAADITAAAATWLTFLIWNAFDSVIQNNSQTFDFQKQAVAALDMRTTDCCLRVHGQVQPFNKPFQLTGHPRFADEMDWPGFHWYCRTSGVLFVAEYDDGFTAKMREGANWFLSERKAGRNPDRNPADAFA